MSNEQKPFTWDKKKVLALLLLVLILGLVFAYRGSRVEAIESIPSATEDNTQFVIAAWDYPDEYGQGIEGFDIYENSTGSWVNTFTIYHNTSNIVEWNESVGIKLRCWTLLNATLTGASTKDIGKNYLRHSVTVYNMGTMVFSQQNFTFGTALDEAYGIYLYGYDVVFDFLPLALTTYTVTVDYEVFFDDGIEEEFDYDVELAADTDDDWWISTGPTHYTDTTTVNCRWSGGVAYAGQMRYQLNIPQNATITSATVTMYDSLDSGPTSDGKIWRIDETNVGSLEGDSSFPIVDDSEYASITWDGSLGWDTYTITDLVQTQVNLSGWSSGNYIGLRFNFTTEDASNNVAWYDFEHANDYHPYLNVTYTACVDAWNEVGVATLLFSVTFDEWGYNVALVILGLIMIPVSTLYLAFGIKHDRTSDRMFYGLIIFAVGFGLVVAGITP